MRKLLVVSIFVMGLLGPASASQPKIVEVTDNFGHTFTVQSVGESGHYDLENGGYFTWREGFARANVQEEVKATDDTTIELCISEVRAQDKDAVRYDFTGWDLGNHKTNTTDSCHSWSLTEDDIMNSWRFEIKANNYDGTEFAGEGDFKFQVRYHNLVPESGESQGETYNYETVSLSRTEYNRLKNRSESYDDLQNKLDQKNQKIDELQNTVSQLENQISELKSEVQELNQTEENGGFLGFLGW